MDNWIILTLVALISVAYTNSQDVNVELEVHPPSVIKEGDTIRLICRIIDPDLFDVNSISRRLDNGNIYDIALNNIKKELFANDARYSTQSQEGSNGVEYAEVVITNAQGRDSGEIICMNKGTNEEAIQEIKVYVPVQELRLKYKIGADGEWTDAADGDTLRFTSGLDVSYACEVKVDGDDTAPIMAVTLNNGDITGDLETEEFDEVVVVANSDDGYSHKKLHRQYTSGANSPDIASPEFNGKRIACTATASEYDPVSVAVDIDVKFSPMAEDDCSRPQFYKVGNGVELTCTMSMNPGPIFDQWQLGDGTVVRSGGPEDARFTASMEELGDDRYLFTMTGEAVEETDDLSVVHLTVKNDDASEGSMVDIDTQQMLDTTTTTTTTTTPKPVNPGPADGDHTDKVTDDGSSASSFVLSSALLTLCLTLSKLFHL